MEIQISFSPPHRCSFPSAEYAPITQKENNKVTVQHSFIKMYFKPIPQFYLLTCQGTEIGTSSTILINVTLG